MCTPVTRVCRHVYLASYDDKASLIYMGQNVTVQSMDLRQRAYEAMIMKLRLYKSMVTVMSNAVQYCGSVIKFIWTGLQFSTCLQSGSLHKVELSFYQEYNSFIE